MDYLVEEYASGKPFYPLSDFIILKEKVSDDYAKPTVTELSKSKEKSVEQDTVVIIHTRNATLDMTIFTYPKCTNRTGLTISRIVNLSESISSGKINLSPGSVYIKHTGRTK